MKSPTLSSRFGANMLEGARLAGHDVQALLLSCDIAPALLEQPRSRLTYAQQSSLLRALMTLMQDEMMGLLDKPVKPNTFRMLAYSMINADTLGDAIEISVSASSVMEVGLQISFAGEAQRSCYIVEQAFPGQVKNAFVIEHLFFVYHRMLCWLTDQMIPIAAVELDYEQPEYADEYRRLFLNAPVSYNRPCCKLYFHNRSLAAKNVRDFHQLKDFLRALPLNMFSSNYDTLEYSSKIRQWLERCLRKEKKLPDIVQTAEHFQTHPQTLRRALAKEGSTYKQIKSATQRDLAIDLIAKSDKSVETLAFEVGFSERAAFIRAFKRWTGLTPLAYRKLSN